MLFIALCNLNLIPNFGSASYQFSLHPLHCHENGLRLRSTAPLVSTGEKLFEGHLPNLKPTEEDAHCCRKIYSTGFGLGGRLAEDNKLR